MIVGTPTLLGERVTLRPYSAGFSEAELARLYHWAQDPDVLALAGGVPVDLDFADFREQFLAQALRHNTSREQVFLVLDERGAAIGRAGLFALDQRPRRHNAELGIVIGERSHWGRGYGRETVRLLLKYGFTDLGLQRISLYTYPDNQRARRAFEAVGFRYVRTLRRFSFERGTHDEHEMEASPESLESAG